MTTNPRPRPAFAKDSTPPALPVAPPAPVLEHALRPKPKQKDKGSHGKDHSRRDGKEVALVLRLPKPVRKRLRAKASDLGMSAEEAAAQVVRMWVDG